MSLITLHLPRMGESVMEAVILDWCIQEGEIVTEGAPLLEVATDKVDAEIPATHNGRIKKLLVKKGDIIAIGTPIALLEVDKLIPPSITSAREQQSCIEHTTSALDPTRTISDLETQSLSLQLTHKLKLSPLAKHIIQKHAIQPDEILKLSACNKDNRVNKATLLNYLKKNICPNPHAADANLFDHTTTPLPGDEVVEMDRVRRLIANRMIRSKQVAPHVTSFIRADVTELVAWRNKYKAFFKVKYGVKLTYNPIFMTLIARTLQLFPLLNAVIVDNHIIKRKHINIGFAVALADGNVLVPVVKEVEQLSLPALGEQIDTLIYKARSGTITPDSLTGASYTISNIGCFDNLMGTPIIVQPQVAILALGLIEKRAVVIDYHGKETIAIGSEMFLSHTYDHRIIDGAIGGGFLKSLAKELKDFVKNIDNYGIEEVLR